jgi:hypothetical protein
MDEGGGGSGSGSGIRVAGGNGLVVHADDLVQEARVPFIFKVALHRRAPLLLSPAAAAPSTKDEGSGVAGWSDEAAGGRVFAVELSKGMGFFSVYTLLF